MNKSKGRNTEHSKKMGQFDRSAFKASGERVFDEKFGFERGLTETFRYANAQKNGNLEQRMALHSEKRDHERKSKQTNTGKQQERKSGSKQPVSLLEKEQKADLPDLLSQVSDTLLRSLLDSPNKGDSAPLLTQRKTRNAEA